MSHSMEFSFVVLAILFTGAGITKLVSAQYEHALSRFILSAFYFYALMNFGWARTEDSRIYFRTLTAVIAFVEITSFTIIRVYRWRHGR